jgi:hypothetical protein
MARSRPGVAVSDVPGVDDIRCGPIAGPQPKGALLHQRAYEIGAYIEDDQHFRLIGHVRDVKPDGMWGIQDIEPLTVHHMELHLVVSAMSLEITEVFTKMHVTPHHTCVLIEAAYQQLVGVSIARGFSNKVKELFGGPRGCTHIGALTNAMAPVAMQTIWAFFHRNHDGPMNEMTEADLETAAAIRKQQTLRNKNTCHVWAEDGEQFAAVQRGEGVQLPVWGIERLRKRGIDPASIDRR